MKTGWKEKCLNLELPRATERVLPSSQISTLSQWLPRVPGPPSSLGNSFCHLRSRTSNPSLQSLMN